MAPLTTRPLDFLYTAFFYVHIAATLLINGQFFYPQDLVPSFLSQLLEWNHQVMRDPLVGGIGQKFAPGSQELDWFKSFTALEFFFQLPVFIVGAWGLRNDNKKLYPLLLAYAASSATTTLACIATVLSTPETTASTLAQNLPSVTNEQRIMLLSSYIPFFLVPFIMAVDMTVRLTSIISGNAQKAKKA